MEVSLTLTSSAAKKFAEATGRLIGKPIAIFMDNLLISAPTVQSQISGGKCVITGKFTAAEAGELASTIKSGALPFKLEPKQVDSVSPTLGQSALNVIVMAGIVALILVWLFMLLYYRLPGILANIALLAHTVIQLLVISWLGLTMTLPGIAGIILTIGMGVDANVIIFERIKEELRNGKTLRASIDVGFKRAFTAILDANMTTLISAAVLYFFGTGAIKNFAITLGLGVALSFLTAVVVSRIMLRSVANVNIAKHHWLYGA
jgi:preprotein translocase subunit SecD